MVQVLFLILLVKVLHTVLVAAVVLVKTEEPHQMPMIVLVTEYLYRMVHLLKLIKAVAAAAVATVRMAVAVVQVL